MYLYIQWYYFLCNWGNF